MAFSKNYPFFESLSKLKNDYRLAEFKVFMAEIILIEEC